MLLLKFCGAGPNEVRDKIDEEPACNCVIALNLQHVLNQSTVLHSGFCKSFPSTPPYGSSCNLHDSMKSQKTK